MEGNLKIAILIDAENVSYKNAPQIIDIMSAKGEIIIKQIITDWTKITKSKIIGEKIKEEISHREQQIAGWREEASKFSMSPVQQFSYVSGKNSCDIAMTIETMKILYEKPFVSTYCIVSNDSDFTKLAQELKSHGKEVVGMGEKGKAINEFVNAFSEFIYLGDALPQELVDEIKAEAKLEEEKNEQIKKDENVSVDNCPLDNERLLALISTINELIEEDNNNEAYYSAIYDSMKKKYSDFIPTNYDCKNVSKMIDKFLPFLNDFKKHAESKDKTNPNAKIMSLRKKT